MIRFLHAADLHLDSPLTGLRQYEGAPVEAVQSATRQALIHLVDLALREAVDFLLIAGDVYDGAWKDVQTGLFFVRQMARLAEAGIPVVTIAGNHDAESIIARHLRLPENVTRLSATAPETVRLPGLPVAVHGQSFAERDVDANLAAAYPRAVSGCLNIGLLHTAAAGHEGHALYAPCSLDDLRRREYDYWALGHVHQRHALHAEGAPPIYFSGNTQGRHIRERGAKGCLLVELESHGASRVRFEPLDAFRWALVDLDVREAEDIDAALAILAERLAEFAGEVELPTAVRVRFVGVCDEPLHRGLLEQEAALRDDCLAIALDVGQERLWIEKVENRTQLRRPLRGLSLRDGPLRELSAVIEELRHDDAARDELKDLFAPLAQKLPHWLADEAPTLAAGDALRECLDDVETLLLARLTGAGEDAG